MSGYETARIADIERSNGWSPIRRFFEIRSFGVNAWTGKEAGTAVIACAEAQLGELDAALEHLRAAVTERPSFAEYAMHDDELEPLRGDPRFSALLAP